MAGGPLPATSNCPAFNSGDDQPRVKFSELPKVPDRGRHQLAASFITRKTRRRTGGLIHLHTQVRPRPNERHDGCLGGLRHIDVQECDDQLSQEVQDNECIVDVLGSCPAILSACRRLQSASNGGCVFITPSPRLGSHEIGLAIAGRARHRRVRSLEPARGGCRRQPPRRAHANRPP